MTGSMMKVLALSIVLLGTPLLGCEGCMKRRPVSEVDLGEWPACAAAERDALLVARELVAGPDMLEKSVVERYSIARHGECYVGRVLLSWKLGETALEVVWDEDFRPLVAYKRMSYPGDTAHFEERAYRMVDQGALMVRVTPEETERFHIVGAPPTAIVPVGRGLFSAAFRRNLGLEVSESNREVALDLRRLIERIELANVRRDPAKARDYAEEPLQTFTFMGRDTMYLDPDGFVTGDLAGLEPSDTVLEDAFAGVVPEIDAAASFEVLRVVGRSL